MVEVDALMNLEILFSLDMKFHPNLSTFLCLFSSNPFYKSLSGTIIQHFESTDSRHNPFWLFCLAQDRNRKWNASVTTVRLSRMAKSHHIVLFHVHWCRPNKWVSCSTVAEVRQNQGTNVSYLLCILNLNVILLSYLKCIQLWAGNSCMNKMHPSQGSNCMWWTCTVPMHPFTSYMFVLQYAYMSYFWALLFMTK